MKFNPGPLVTVVVISMSVVCQAQVEPTLEEATPAVLRAFQSHDIVMLGETHGNKKEYEWLRSLVATPEFADRADDIVLEFGNSLYQESVDRYVRGEDVPLQEVQRAWRDTVASVGPPSPVYQSLYQAVRETNRKRQGKHQIRVLCGDPDIDWLQVNEGKDLLPYLRSRDQSYAEVVRKEVLAEHHHALLVMGAFHFVRHFDLMPGRKQFDIEQQLRGAGANPYLIVSGTNTTGQSEDPDHRFDSWPNPVIVSSAGSWVSELPAISILTGGHGPSFPSLTLKDAADALLYLGPRNSLVTVQMPRSELEGTAYGKELERRRKIQLTLDH